MIIASGFFSYEDALYFLPSWYYDLANKAGICAYDANYYFMFFVSAITAFVVIKLAK